MKHNKSKQKKSEKKDKKSTKINQKDSDESFVEDESSSSKDSKKGSKVKKTIQNKKIKKKKDKDPKENEITSMKFTQINQLQFSEDQRYHIGFGGIKRETAIEKILYLKVTKKILVITEGKSYLYNALDNYEKEEEIAIELTCKSFEDYSGKIWDYWSLSEINIYDSDTFEKETTISLKSSDGRSYLLMQPIQNIPGKKMLITTFSEIIILDEDYQISALAEETLHKEIQFVLALNEECLIAVTGTQTLKLAKYLISEKKWDRSSIAEVEDEYTLSINKLIKIGDILYWVCYLYLTKILCIKKINIKDLEVYTDISIDFKEIDTFGDPKPYVMEGNICLNYDDKLLYFCPNFKYYEVKDAPINRMYDIIKLEDDLILIQGQDLQVKIFKVVEEN